MSCLATVILAAAVAASASSRAQPAAPRAQPTDTLHRFFDFQTATAETRYRFIETSAGVTSTNQWQHKQTVKSAFKFDEQGRYSAQALLGTGNSFTGSWDPTGAGTGSPTWDFRVRRLWARAAPASGLEFDAGSFDVLRGEATEIVTYDNDAYMEGYRASLKRPNQFYFDEISVTAGYLGDLTTANVFHRFKRMDDHNYTQVLLGKRVGSTVSATLDWTSTADVTTWREGVRFSTTALHIGLDDVRVELYQRAEAPSGAGGAVTAERALSRRVSVYGGYAHVDRNMSTLSGDRYARGQRVYTGGAFVIAPELVASMFYTHAFANDFPVANNQRLDLVLTYNVLKALQQHH